MSYLKKAVWIVLILLIALFFRLLFLHNVPIAISGDELDYVFTAKSLWLTGHDITGTWNPLSFTTPPLEVPKAELPYLFLLPFIGPFSFSLFAARVPFVFFNCVLIIAIILLTARLINWKTAIVAGFLCAINPWFIYFSRTSFDTPLATTFIYLGILLLFTQRSWKILWSFPFFLIGFYSYIGTKIVFLPFVLTAIIGSYYILNNKKYKKQHILLAVLSILLVISFIFSFTHQRSKSRTNDIYTPFIQQNQTLVNNKRRMTIVNPVTAIFVNKYTEYIKNRAEVYAGFFSPHYLFFYGDSRAPFSIWEYGVMHYIDLIFIIIGIAVLFTKKRRLGILLISLLLIAPIPSIVSSVGVSYSIRSNLAFPLLIIFGSYGITFTATYFYKRKLFIYSIVTGLYIISTLYFMHTYLYRNPIYNSEGLDFSGRIAGSYINYAVLNNKQLVILTDGSSNLLRYYIFYYNILSKDTFESIKSVLTGKTNQFNTITISKCDDKLPVNKNTIIITKSGGYCDERFSSYNSITQLSDGGEVYRIYNDSICSIYTLANYPSSISMQDFNVEKLSEKDFCETFISQPIPNKISTDKL